MPESKHGTEENIPHPGWTIRHDDGVRRSLEKHLGQFLRQQRGAMTFAEFARKTGLPPSTLHRLESGGQSLTLGRLQQIMTRLKVRLADIFPAEWVVGRGGRK